MKFAHKLVGCQTTQMPHNFVFMDTETFPEHKDVIIQRLKLGCASFVRLQGNGKIKHQRELTFTKTGPFWDALDSFCYVKTKTILYCHNMHFDFMVVDGIGELTKRGWKLVSFFVKSSVFIMSWGFPTELYASWLAQSKKPKEFKGRKWNRRLQVLDSGNILKVKLATIGEAVGFPKLDVDFSTVSDKDLEIYCRRDVEILKEWILKYWKYVKKHDLGTYRTTQAGQAFMAFRHRFMPCDIFIHNYRLAIELERAAYFGGRTEAFFIGKVENGHHIMVDINSQYPHQMKTQKFPIKLLWHEKQGSIKAIKKFLKTKQVIARVILETDEPIYPFRGKRTIFPVGRFETSLCTPELIYGMEHGHIKEVKDFAVYESAKIFEPYVDFFYAQKVEHKESGNFAEYMLAKLFQNKLYGKFGQKSTDIKRIGPSPPDIALIDDVFDHDTGKSYVRYLLNGQEYRTGAQRESFNSFVAIASHVTAYARMYLWHLIKLAGLENVVYMDTDSLLVNEEGYERLTAYMHPTKLGMLDVQADVKDFQILGVKDYVLDGKIKIKGIRNPSLRIPDLTEAQRKKYMEFIDLNALEDPENTYIQEQFMKFASLLRSGINNAAAIKIIPKRLKRDYQKGHVESSGRVRPYSLPEDSELVF